MAVTNCCVSLCVIFVFCVLSSFHTVKSQQMNRNFHNTDRKALRFKRQAISYDQELTQKSFPENSDVTTTFYDFTSLQIDGKGASSFTFNIVTNEDSKPSVDTVFQINSDRKVKFADGLSDEDRSNYFDYEQYPEVVIVVEAVDRSDVQGTDKKLIKLTIPLTDVNDELPVLENKPVPYLAAVPVKPKEGATVYELLAEDPDGNPDLVYSIDASKATAEVTNHFRMDIVEEGSGNNRKVLGHIKVALRTELVQGDKYDIPVKIEDRNGLYPQIITANVEVLVGPRAPQFYEEKYKGSIFETTTTNNPVNTQDESSDELIVKVRSFQGNFPKKFEILEDNNQESKRFRIDNRGKIFNKEALDYDIEKTQRPPIFSLHINVTETLEDGTTELVSTVPLEIEVKDENDNPPRFQYTQYLKTVPEDTSIGSTILKVLAEDDDSDSNAKVTYELSSNYFAIQEVKEGGKTIGAITVKDNLDFDAPPGPIYRFMVFAKDGGAIPLSSSVDVVITTSNVNDEKPVIVSQGNVVLRDKVDVSQNPFFLTRVRAQDDDGDGVAFYLNDNGNKVTSLDIFRITPSSGVIEVVKPVPLGKDSYLLKIIAEDDGKCCPGNKKLRDNMQFLVEIVDSINQKPTFEKCLDYTGIASFLEESPSGTPVVKVSATDTDRGLNAIVRYTIVSPNPSLSNAPFQINSTTGQITTKSKVNREEVGVNFIQVTVKATDQGESPQEGWCTFRVEIKDINDNNPIFNTERYTQEVSSKTTKGKVLLRVGASDFDIGENAEILYTLENDGDGVFGIYEDSGLIYLAENFKAGITKYTLKVKATDKGTVPLSGNVEVVIKVTSQEASTPPKFQTTDRTFTVAETAPTNHFITKLKCTSQTEADPRVQFFLVSEDGQLHSQKVGKFSIRTPTASSNEVTLTVADDLDYESMKQHIVTLRCQNFAALTMYEQIQLTINIQDKNDEVPTFPGWIENGRYQAGVLENQAANVIVIKDIQADDRDISEQFNQVQYSIDNTSYPGVMDDFSISTLEGNKAEIRTKRAFNREDKDRYILIITANDIRPSDIVSHFPPGTPNSATVVLQVTIQDENDNPMTFKQSLYNHTVKETASIGFVIFAVTADDPDEVDQGKLLYSFENDSIPFDIRDRTGEIFVTGKLDYETLPRDYLLTLKSRDSLNLFTAETQVRLTLTDENDNVPTFEQSEYEVRDIVEEDTSVNASFPKPLVKVKANDKDTSRTKQILYNLLGEGTEPGAGQLFTINSQTGQIFLIATLDRDKPAGKAEYIFTVEARDEETNPQKGYANVKVFPIDINDNKPKFDRDSLQESRPENLEDGSFVAQVKATDADAGKNAQLVYDIIKSPATTDDSKTNYFHIEPSGRISTQVDKKYLDRETMPYLEVLVKATDQGDPSQSQTATLTIILTDENDNVPKFIKKLYNYELSENQVSGVILDVQATDDDINENAVLTFSIEDNDFFKMDNINNKGYITIKAPVDYEEPNERHFLLKITVHDTDPSHQDQAMVNITVTDFNDMPPEFTKDKEEVHILEGETPGKNVTKFTAHDEDSGINAELSYTIERSSDPRREFYIDEDTGVVWTRKRLDRETAERMEVIILAIDKGDPQLTGSATMVVIVDDINDNFPIFKEDYQPVVMENGGPSDLPLELFAKDLDTARFGPPFGFSLLDNCEATNVACQKFTLTFNPNGDEGDGTATVRTDATFDREEQKYYELPIVMWDMRGSGDPQAQTGTNTLTITIGDENDNKHKPGHQEVFVYNYKGTFGPLVIGRVYVEDKDDWDLPDKSFNFISPSSLKSYFSVDLATGDITMKKGVVANFGQDPYKFSVSVYDKHFDATVVSTVAVTVMDLTEEAVFNSGGVRFTGITASDFILEKVDPRTGVKKDSLYSQFRAFLAQKLSYPVDNVEIINLRDGDGYLEVRYSAHGSPYLSPAEMDNVVLMNQAELEAMGLTVGEVPIDECQDEIFEGGCYNKLTVTGNPVTVNANGTSYVGVEAFMVATQGCEADAFPETNQCTGSYCHNGGQCVKDDWGNLQCLNCPAGYTGSRCQERRHSFDGNSVTTYRTLTQCEESQTSIEFITQKEDGVILYNGPLKSVNGLETPADFIFLGLKGGYPLLRIDHGTGVSELTLDGKDQNGKQLLQKLNDGKWHHIDINRRGKEVELVVDRCAVAETSRLVVDDDRACRVVMETPGVNMYLNVNTLLMLGGVRLLENSVTHLDGLTLDGFDGCLRNFVHNKRLYDLHVREIAGVNSGKNGCPREDAFCNPPPNNKPVCGVNGECEATLSGATSCTCHRKFWGAVCDKAASVRDYQRGGYYLWEMKESFFNKLTRNRDIRVDVMFRTRQREGALIVMEDTSSSSSTHHIRLMLSEGNVKLTYNLGEKDKELVLSNATANNGQWHAVTVERYGTEFHLKMDNGEGRNYAYTLGSGNGKERSVFKINRRIYSGGYKVSKEELESSCVQDVRINNGYFAMTVEEGNDPDAQAIVDENPNTREGCTRDDCCTLGTCSTDKCASQPNAVCFPLWEDFECRCRSGYHGPQCVSMCFPNPCFNNVTCMMKQDDIECQCPSRWRGKLCDIMGPEEVATSDMSDATLIAIIVSIIIVILIALMVFLIYFKLCRNGDDGEKYILEVDPEDDIRENVMNYDEEGAGEKDQDAYDISRLQGAGETLNRPYDPDKRRDMPALRNAPGDKPDVGNFIDDRMRDADNDGGAPPHDSVREFNFEGGDSDAGSLSSLNTSSSDRSQDYDYLNEWGPKFSKLADMYGAGQDLPSS